MLATVRSATILGVEGRPVTVEVHVADGLPGFTMVGLPDAMCREARDRARAAVQNTDGVDWPPKKVTVNLAPSSERKVGTGLDLAIALGYLAATGKVPPPALDDLAVVGELGLDGSLRPVPGTLALVDAVEAKRVLVPTAAHHEARLVERVEVVSASTLGEVIEALRGAPWPDPPPDPPPVARPPEPDLADVRGQPVARQALEVAAAGGHHLLFVGAPGAGKTMLARRLPGLLPPLARPDALAAPNLPALGSPSASSGLLSSLVRITRPIRPNPSFSHPALWPTGAGAL